MDAAAAEASRAKEGGMSEVPPSPKIEAPVASASAADGKGDEEEEEDGFGYVTVATSEQLAREDSRMHVEVRGRHVAIARRDGRLYAIDATCYHMGAPLLHGDIEDVPGHGACIVCPWHHYQISLSTGERLYQDMHRKTCTLPKKQRVHEVREANGEVQVRLNGGGKPASPPPGQKKPEPHEVKYEWESDRYAFKAPPPSQRTAGGGGRVRSGHLFKGGGRGRGGAPYYPGAGSGLHPGLRGRGVGQMVAQSMKGGDGKAPWAMAPGGGLRMPPPPPSRRGIAATSSQFAPGAKRAGAGMGAFAEGNVEAGEAVRKEGGGKAVGTEMEIDDELPDVPEERGTKGARDSSSDSSEDDDDDDDDDDDYAYDKLRDLPP